MPYSVLLSVKLYVVMLMILKMNDVHHFDGDDDLEHKEWMVKAVFHAGVIS